MRQVYLQVLIVFVAMLIVLLSVFYIYTNFFRIQPTFVGGFNWTDAEIEVEIGDLNQTVQAGEMFSFQMREKGTILISIKDINSEIIRENIYDIGDKTSVIMELVSTKPENECIVKANMSNLYYDINDGDNISDEIVITQDSKMSYIYEFQESINTDFLVYPGNYNAGFLPENINSQQQVNGLFFVSCDNIDSESDLHADILGSIYYGQE